MVTYFLKIIAKQCYELVVLRYPQQQNTIPNSHDLLLNSFPIVSRKTRNLAIPLVFRLAQEVYCICNVANSVKSPIFAIVFLPTCSRFVAFNKLNKLFFVKVRFQQGTLQPF